MHKRGKIGMPEPKKEKVLITGATGFVGANLAERLVCSPMFAGYKPHCRWAFDREFYSKYLRPYEKIKQKPISYREVFGEIELP